MKSEISSKFLKGFAYFDLVLSPLIFIVPGMANEYRFMWWSMLTMLAINCVCAAEMIRFLDLLMKRLGL